MNVFSERVATDQQKVYVLISITHWAPARRWHFCWCAATHITTYLAHFDPGALLVVRGTRSYAFWQEGRSAVCLMAWCDWQLVPVAWRKPKCNAPWPLNDNGSDMMDEVYAKKHVLMYVQSTDIFWFCQKTNKNHELSSRGKKQHHCCLHCYYPSLRQEIVNVRLYLCPSKLKSDTYLAHLF